MDEYSIIETEDVPVTDLSNNDDIPPDMDMRAVSDSLGTEEVALNIWYFEPGEEIGYHAHSKQEEIYYIIQGEFSLKIGEPDDTEIVEIGSGAFYAVEPGIGHGHRYLGDDQGIILSIGSPAVEDPGFDPHEG